MNRLQGLVGPMATEPRAVRFRLIWVGMFVALCLVLVGVRAYRISIVQHDDYAKAGNRQQIRAYTMMGVRGTIVDRNYEALAVSDRMFQIVLNPREIATQHAEQVVIRAILQLFPNTSPEYLLGELARDKAYRRLRMMVDGEQARQLREQAIPGLTLERSAQRVYPRKLLASHILGRVGAQGKGNLGVEYSLDPFLRGRDASSPAFVAHGSKILVDGVPDASVSSGHTIVLTVDSGLQAIVENELDALVETWTPQSASIVVLHPHTGEVLAIASRPTFNPNRSIDTLEQTVNQAVQREFEPGSTVKAVTVAAALEEGAIRPDETFFCEMGRWQYTDEHTIRDTKALGWLSVTEVLAVSSNICTTKIYERLGKRRLHQWIHRFGFGQRPGIELPAAAPGTVAPWEEWSDIQAANISFGQGMSASPLQVAAAFAALANQGMYNEPTLVSAILDVDGKAIVRPSVEPRRVIRAQTAALVMKMLEEVVHSRTGTGDKARVPGYRVAGKTSTAQKASREGGYDDEAYFASFVGAVPARAPRLVILVSVDQPVGGHYGNQVAAPTFARVASRAMELYAVAPDDDAALQPRAVVLSSTGALQEGFVAQSDIEPPLPGKKSRTSSGLPDFTGQTMAEVLDGAHALHVHVRLHGSGLAVMQDHAPGPIARGTRVNVYFEGPL